MTDYMVTGLSKKRAEIAGQIERTQERMRQLVADLEHVDATLRIVAPEMEVISIAPKVFRPPADWSKRGEMTRVVLGILRKARGPMTTREIAAEMAIQRGLTADANVINALTRRVACALRRQRDLGHARSVEGEAGFWHLWELTR